MIRYLALVALLFSYDQALAQWPSFLGKGLPAWEKQLQSRDAKDRHEAAWAIAQLEGKASEELRAARQHEDPVVRYWAILGLGRSVLKSDSAEQKQIVADQLKQSLTDKAAAPRIAAAAQLARLGHVEEALPVLVAALEDPQDSAGQQAAAALVALGKQAAPARAKLEVAAKTGGEYVKRLATKALAQLQE
jgi:hypothetical protein